MLNLRHIFSFTGLILLIAYPMSANATQSYQTTGLTVILKSSRPLPPDLVPLLYNDNVYEEIHGVTGGFPNVTKMKLAAPSRFTAEVRWHQPKISLAIDHPGFLRGFSTLISANDPTTQTIALPEPGSLRASLDLQHIRAANQSRYSDAEQYGLTSYLTTQGPNSFQIHNPVIPLPKWNLYYKDLAPGTYRISASNVGRADTAGTSYFPIKSGHLTELGLPIFTRTDFKKSKTTSPTITIKPINSPALGNAN